jgi:hypothetical protein
MVVSDVVVVLYLEYWQGGPASLSVSMIMRGGDDDDAWHYFSFWERRRRSSLLVAPVSSDQ